MTRLLVNAPWMLPKLLTPPTLVSGEFNLTAIGLVGAATVLNEVGVSFGASLLLGRVVASSLEPPPTF